MRMPSIDKGDGRNRTTSIDIGNKRRSKFFITILYFFFW